VYDVLGGIVGIAFAVAVLAGLLWVFRQRHGSWGRAVLWLIVVGLGELAIQNAHKVAR
jgi:hypothetical protein